MRVNFATTKLLFGVAFAFYMGLVFWGHHIDRYVIRSLASCHSEKQTIASNSNRTIAEEHNRKTDLQMQQLQRQVINLNVQLEEARKKLVNKKSKEENDVSASSTTVLQTITIPPKEEVKSMAIIDDRTFTNALRILPHELPGYTGWARPVHSLVDSFELVHYEPSATAGQNWTVQVQCLSSVVGQQGGSLFYVRAYGRSLLPGTVQDHQNGTYTVTILPHDAGTYTLEVVLTISQKPDYKIFPQRQREDPSYEGHLLPGFPLQFTVKDPSPAAATATKRGLRIANNNNAPKQQPPKSPTLPQCTAHQLTETSLNSPLETGRWLVTQRTTKPFPSKAISRPGVHVTNLEEIHLKNYKNNKNALGIQMDYFYNDCNVLSYKEMTSPQKWRKILEKRHSTNNNNRPIHILYVGDSNTRNQYNYFREHVGGKLGEQEKYLGKIKKLATGSWMNGQVKLSYIDMMGHWQDSFPKTRQHVEFLTKHPLNQNDTFYVLFNAGLHEISHRCMRNGAKGEPEPEGRCHNVYAKDLKELTALIKSFPASLRVWQNTVAGWPKWGVFGVSWPQALGQRFPMEPNFCDYMNELAWNVMQTEQIPVMDSYWMTLSRPDHREVIQAENFRTSYKLVHLGDEVYSFLVRKFVHVIFEAIERGETNVPYL